MGCQFYVTQQIALRSLARITRNLKRKMKKWVGETLEAWQQWPRG
jgi:hypothetical protein